MVRRISNRLIVGAGVASVVLAGTTGIAIREAGASVPAKPPDPRGGTGSFLLAATNTGQTYTPTFTGNGELGIRVPPLGQGYGGGVMSTPSELAGFYAQPPGGVQKRADIPTWTTLTYS